MSTDNRFGQLLRAARLQKRLTQAAVANLVMGLDVPMSQPYVSQLETGAEQPDHWECLALCLALRLNAIDAFDALGWIGDEPEWGKRLEKQLASLLKRA